MPPVLRPVPAGVLGMPGTQEVSALRAPAVPMRTSSRSCAWTSLPSRWPWRRWRFSGAVRSRAGAGTHVTTRGNRGLGQHAGRRCHAPAQRRAVRPGPLRPRPRLHQPPPAPPRPRSGPQAGRPAAVLRPAHQLRRSAALEHGYAAPRDPAAGRRWPPHGPMWVLTTEAWESLLAGHGPVVERIDVLDAPEPANPVSCRLFHVRRMLSAQSGCR